MHIDDARIIEIMADRLRWAAPAELRGETRDPSLSIKAERDLVWNIEPRTGGPVAIYGSLKPFDYEQDEKELHDIAAKLLETAGEVMELNDERRSIRDELAATVSSSSPARTPPGSRSSRSSRCRFRLCRPGASAACTSSSISRAPGRRRAIRSCIPTAARISPGSSCSSSTSSARDIVRS